MNLILAIALGIVLAMVGLYFLQAVLVMIVMLIGFSIQLTEKFIKSFKADIKKQDEVDSVVETITYRD